MRTCPTKKRQYLTQVQAEEALIEARKAYPQREGPIAVYQCDDCGYYHLTSKGEVNSRLAEFLKSHKMDLHREADHWVKKMKKK
jgi:hypothetical protein